MILIGYLVNETLTDSGQFTVNSYGFEAFIAAFLLGLIRTFGSSVAIIIINKHRRRRIYALSGFLTSLILIAFGAVVWQVKKNPDNKYLPWIALGLASLEICFVNCGFVLVPQLLSSIVYPNEFRPLMKCLTRCIQCLIMFGFLFVSSLA